VFTNDVENNPFGCKLGSYYDTGGMKEIKLTYLGESHGFIKALVTDSLNKGTTVYFENKWIKFNQ
jgi:hypothetical protein